MKAQGHQNRENPERYRVLLVGPLGRSVQTLSGRHLNVASDGTLELSVKDAEPLIRNGWQKLAEWIDDELPEAEPIAQRNRAEGPKPAYAKGSIEWQAEQEEKKLARIAAEAEKEQNRRARVTAALERTF